MDSISCGATVAWAFEAFNEGKLTLEDTDGLDLSWGNADSMVKLTEKIAKREGFGDLLAEGSARAAKKIGRGIEEYLITFNAKMDVYHADGRKIVENDPISMSRDLTFDEGAVLGKFSEEETIHEDLILRSSTQVLRRLQALITARKKNQ